MNVLEVQNLSALLKTKEGMLAVTRQVSFSLKKNEILGIAGESGCGKTMTMLALAGLLPAGSLIQCQKLSLAGHLFDPSTENNIRGIRAGGISYIFQEPSNYLNPLLSIGDELTETITCNNRSLSRKMIKQGACKILESVGLVPAGRFYGLYPHQLSGGMNQRAMIGLALAGNPKVLIADEPTTALDLVTQQSIVECILSLVKERGLSVIWVSHDISLMENFADTMAIMYAGDIVETGPARDVVEHPQHPYTQALIRCLPERLKEKRFQPIPGIVASLDPQRQGCAYYPRCPFAMPACLIHEPCIREHNHSHKIKCCLQRTI